MPHIVLRWDGESDGDSSHRPTGVNAAAHRPADPEYELLYRQKLGQQLMIDNGRAQQGKQYVLDQLPDGYILWEKTRPSNPKHIDRYLYGHPKHMYFDSPYAFLPHLKWLSDGQEGTCPCVRCEKLGKSTSKISAAPRKSSGKVVSMRPRPRPRLPFSKGPVDEEGVPYTIPNYLALLHKEGKLERPIEENLSMDWCVESIVNEETKKRLSTQGSFVPRVGEVVLWYWSIDGELRIDPETAQLKIWNWDVKAFTGHPTWLCGVVTQAPIAEEPVRVDDITRETPKKHGVNNSGFRIECYPDPNEEDKAFSKQYTYVPMHHIRPMAFFLDVTKGIPDTEWHPTLFNAMKAMSCVSCIDRYKLKGTWPDFHMYHRGVFFGAESYWIGDVIRLIPRKEEGQKRITEVIVPTSIVVRTYGMKPETDGTITGTNADSIELVLQGHVYTTDPKYSQGQLADLPTTLILHPYGPWYHREGPYHSHEVQYQHTVGRLFEYQAMKRWYPNITPNAALNAGFGSVAFTRRAAIKQRTQQGGNKPGYFWGEHRADALDLATFNGIDVGIYDMDRDPQKWRQVLAVLDGERKIPEGPAPRNVAPVANMRGSAPSAVQPLGKGKEKVVIELDSDSDDEVDETIDGLISGEGFVEEEAGERSSKRARMQ